MKITRRQLRRLIQEAMYSPVAAMSTAKERIARRSAEASEEAEEEIDYLAKAMPLLRSDDEADQKLGRNLLDTIGGFSSPGIKGVSTPELKFSSTKNPDKTGTIQHRYIPSDVTSDSELAKSEFIGDSKDIRDEIRRAVISTATNTIYKPFIEKLQLNDIDAFFSTPQWKESVRSFQDQYIDVVAGEESFGIGFDTSGDRFPSEEIDRPNDIMRNVYGEMADHETEAGYYFNLFDILEDIDKHFNVYGSQYHNEIAQSYDYDPQRYGISSSYGQYMFSDLVDFFEKVKREIDDGFHNAIYELHEEGIISTADDGRFLVFNPEAYDQSNFSR